MAYTQNPGGPRQARTGGNIPTSFMSGPAQVDRDAIKKSLESLRIKKDKDATDLKNKKGKLAAEKARKGVEAKVKRDSIKALALKKQGNSVTDSIKTVINKGEAAAANKFGNAGRAARTGGTKNEFGKGLPTDGSETKFDTRKYKYVSGEMAKKESEGLTDEYY